MWVLLAAAITFIADVAASSTLTLLPSFFLLSVRWRLLPAVAQHRLQLPIIGTSRRIQSTASLQPLPVTLQDRQQSPPRLLCPVSHLEVPRLQFPLLC